MDHKELNEALASNYMLLQVAIGTGPSVRTNKVVTEEVIHAKEAKHGAAKVLLVLDNHPTIKAMKARYAAVRTLQNTLALPWSGKERIISTASTMNVLKELSDVIKEADAYRDSVVAPEWENIKKEVIDGQGKMADEDMLPNKEALKHKYYARVMVRPMPSVSDFSRLNVPAPVADALASRMTKQAEAALGEAVDELNSRLLKEVERMATQLSKQASGVKTKLYDSLVTNIERLVPLLRDMNVRKDPKLDDLANRIEAELLQNRVDVYRNNQTVAAAVAKKAETIASAIKKDLMEVQIDEEYF